MGQTSLNTASNLIARGYAFLSDHNQGTTFAQITFPRDPVLAHIAMCIMTGGSNGFETLSCPSTQDSKFWSKKIASVFSTGLCRPDRGGVGEISIGL